MPLVHIDRTLDWRRREERNKKRRKKRLFPESGASASASLGDQDGSGEDDTNPEATYSFTTPTLFGVTLVFDEGSEGVIFGTGTSTLSGALVAVYDDNLIIRCGSSLLPPVDDQSRLVVPISLLPRGRRCRLSWYFRPSISDLMKVKAWVDGRVIGISESVVPVAAWSSPGIGGFNSVPGTIPVEPEETLQAYGDSNSSIVSELRSYTGFPDGI